MATAAFAVVDGLVPDRLGVLAARPPVLVLVLAGLGALPVAVSPPAGPSDLVVTVVVVEYRDRLTRFGFEHVAALMSAGGGRIVGRCRDQLGGCRGKRRRGF
jgi:hypothetical protein